MRISELQAKDIVNINDGKRVGRIIDAEVDLEGKITALVIEQKRAIKVFMTSNYQDLTITYKQIKKIGEDVILVDF